MFVWTMDDAIFEGMFALFVIVVILWALLTLIGHVLSYLAGLYTRACQRVAAYFHAYFNAVFPW